MKKLILICLLLLLMGTQVSAASAEGDPGAAQGSGNAQSAPVPQKGWQKINGKKRYYRKAGVYVTGFCDIGGNTYYFDENGYLLKSAWITKPHRTYRTDYRGIIFRNKLKNIGGKVYYFNSKGAMRKGWKTFPQGRSYFNSKGVRVTGLRTIDGKIYYFNSKGIMQTGVIAGRKDTVYHFSSDGSLDWKKEGTVYYRPSGERMEAESALETATMQTARRIVAQITNPSMTREQKLETCFRWVMAKYYYSHRSFQVYVKLIGWPAVYANDHFSEGRGNCISDAAAFAYLAKALGYKKIYICSEGDGTLGDEHAWTEINGLVYDPLFAQAKSYSRNYAVTYPVYGWAPAPVLHYPI